MAPDNRRHWGLTDEQIEEVAGRVARILEQDEDGLCDRIAQQLERRMFEWVGRKAAQWLLLLFGSAIAGAYLFIQYLKAQGVM
jgi:hypothetical protein